MGAVVAGLHAANGVELISSAIIEDFYSCEGNVTGLRLAGGGYVAADVVVIGIGAEPNTGWLAGSGLELRGASCATPWAAPDCRASSPWGTAPRGSTPRPDTTAGWSTGPAPWSARRWLSQALLDADAARQPAKPPTSGPTSTASSSSSPGTPPATTVLEIEAGDPLAHSFLAVYYRGDAPVAVLGMNQPKLFTKWRRSLGPVLAAPAPVLAAPTAVLAAPARGRASRTRGGRRRVLKRNSP